MSLSARSVHDVVGHFDAIFFVYFLDVHNPLARPFKKSYRISRFVGDFFLSVNFLSLTSVT